ncbi:hypothetical protein [Halodurantibacterium flavum]|uniref:Uncharacterized protein n=1 Tax=Halodurantibacterium flavum TaxID=1382802 RepID=A0ABW4RZS3_9RHOB
MLKPHRRYLPAVLALAVLMPVAPAFANGDDGPVTRVRLVVIQEGEETRGFSMSMGTGTYVETAALVTPMGIATGVIASDRPVGAHEWPEGFDLFTSPVGPPPP